MKILAPALASLLALTLSACGSDGPAGTYVLVNDAAFKEGMMANMPKGLPKETADMMSKTIDAMSVTLTLKPDETFEAETTSVMKFTSAGTWKLSGSELTLTATTMNGKKQDPPDTYTLVYEGGRIRVPKGTAHMNLPVEVVLKRS